MMKRFALLLIATGLLGGCALSPQQQAEREQSNQSAKQSNIDRFSYSLDARTGICYAGNGDGLPSAQESATIVPCTQKVLQQINISPAGQAALQQTQQNGIQPFVWGAQ